MMARDQGVDTPIDFVEQIERQRCVVFVGSEVSLPSGDLVGPPGAAQLALELALRLGSRLDDYSLPWVTQLYADRNGIQALREYVAGRLGNDLYRPTLAHFLLAQLPVQLIVYTAQDRLLLEAFRRLRMPVNHVLHSDSLSYGAGKTVIQLFGTVERPDTLLLTEDQRRQVFDEQSGLSRLLRDRAENDSLLFVGYNLNEPFFREFYYRLRPQVKAHSPRAYLVQADVDEDDRNYWLQRNATALQEDAAVFLRSLRDTLARRGMNFAPLEDLYEDPPLMEDEACSRRDEILKFGRLLGLPDVVENRIQLQENVGGLRTIGKALHEVGTAASPSPAAATGPSSLSAEAQTPQILLQQGNVEWLEGDHDRAREYYEEAIRSDEGFIEAHFSLYYLLVETGQLEEAFRVYNEIIRRAPNRALFPARYHVQKILGQSDLGISYCVEDSEAKQIKTLTALRQSPASLIEALNELVKEVGKIESRRISRLLGYDRHHGRGYLITEYVEGPSLRARLRSGERIPLSEAIAIIDQVAEALEDGARQGIPHLNLQPNNIILSPNGVGLINYGFSRLKRLMRQAGGLTTRQKAEYESPEQRAGESGDERSDVYALGTLLYEMLSGRPPGLGTFQALSELDPQFDEAIDVLIARARALDPAKRFDTVAEIRKEMQRIFLSLRRGWPGQYLRLVLARLSGFYDTLFSRRGLLILLPLLAMVLAAEVNSDAQPWRSLGQLRGASRVILLLLVSGLFTSSLGHYVVRETARQRGLGSLIASGRGMGGSLGWLFLFWMYRITNFVEFSLRTLDAGDFAGYLFLGVAFAVIATFVSLAFIVNNAGRLAERWWHRYTLGFYTSYVILILIVALLAWLRVPSGALGYL
jgi:tetratricopeptide (TPR) repeat protein